MKRARDELLGQLQHLIARHGWALTGVGESSHQCGLSTCPHRDKPAAEQDPFLYTVGLTNFGRPELLVRHLKAGPAALLLNQMGRRSVDQAALVPGEVYQAGELMVVAEPVEWAEAAQVCKAGRALFGHRLQVLELRPAALMGGGWPA